MYINPGICTQKNFLIFENKYLHFGLNKFDYNTLLL